MNKNRIFAIFILFALLITFAGVSFASSDMDDSYISNDIDEISIDDDLDDIDLDDEDWEDYDDEYDPEDEDWEDYDDEYDPEDEDWEDYDDEYGIDDEDWERLHDYYDSFNKTYYVWKSNDGHIIRYITYNTAKSSSSSSYDENTTDDNCTDNETEEFYEEMIYCYKGSAIGSAAYSCPLMDDQSSNNYQNYNSASEKIDYPDINTELSNVDDDENTSVANDDISKNISLNKSFDNNIFALVAFLIISVLMLI